jgi:hypothetical protein
MERTIATILGKVLMRIFPTGGLPAKIFKLRVILK